MSFAATTIGVGLGLLLGTLAGYLGGAADDGIMRFLDVLMAFPLIVLVLLFVSMLGPELWLIVLLVGIGWMPSVARVMRGLTVEIAQREFIEALNAVGVPTRRIIVRDVLPNLILPITVEYGLRLTWSIGVIAAISFLGFGIQPPTADWGLMINENRNGLAIQPWGLLAPVLMIATFTIGTNLIAEGTGRSLAQVDTGKGDR